MSTQTELEAPAVINDVSAETLKSWLDAGEVVLIDVREDYEHASEHIDGATLHPLSKFDAEKIRDAFPGKRVLFHCRSGKRSREAAERFGKPGDEVFHLAGGIEGWKAAGLPVKRAEGAPVIPVMRQVQIVAGGLVVLGIVLTLTVSQWFLFISAFVGCGLMFAGVTGWCGMAKLLGVMPWNKVKGQAASASCCTA
jgi:rhodanese-related sulfurtransferase